MSLAISDLLKVILEIPLRVISSANKRWIFGDLGDFYTLILIELLSIII